MRRLQTTSVKSHARKKPRVGYFLSLSIDQIKMHQSRNWLLTCDWRSEVGAVLRHRKKCTQPCTVIFFFLTYLLISHSASLPWKGSLTWLTFIVKSKFTCESGGFWETRGDVYVFLGAKEVIGLSLKYRQINLVNPAKSFISARSF